MTQVVEIDLAELGDSARRLLGGTVRRTADSADSAALRRQLTELGWTALTAPEIVGGLAQPFPALGMLYEEMGRALSPVSIAESMATIDALAPANGANELLRQIVVGDARVTLA